MGLLMFLAYGSCCAHSGSSPNSKGWGWSSCARRLLASPSQNSPDPFHFPRQSADKRPSWILLTSSFFGPTLSDTKNPSSLFAFPFSSDTLLHYLTYAYATFRHPRHRRKRHR